jgi:hypothetical protein
MVPNVPTFYDPDNTPTDHENLDYQQWLQANAIRVNQGGYDYLRQDVASSLPLPYRQPNNHVQQAQPIPAQTPIRSQYNFVHSQPPPVHTQYVGGNQGGLSYQPQQQQPVASNNEQYFYPRLTPEVMSSQQPVQHSSPSSYQYPQQFYQTQFTIGASAPESHLVTGRPSSSSEYLGYATNLKPHSLSPMSDIPSYGSEPTPPPRPNESTSNTVTPSAKQPGGKGKGRNAKRQRQSKDSASDTDDDDKAHVNPQIYIQVEPLPRGSDHSLPTRP